MSEIKTENMEDLKPLTTFDVAKHCKVNHRTVLQWVTSNKLKAYRTPGNHSRVDVKDFIIFLQEYNMPIPSEFMGFCNQMQNNMTRVLRTTLGKMELALGAIKEAILWTDLNGRIQWSNTTFHEIINKEKIFTLGSDIFEVLPLRTDDGVEIPKERHPVQLVISTKGFVDNYYQYIRDGHKYIFYMSIAYIKSVQNDASIIISIQDITQRRELGEEKKLLETKYESQKEFTSTVSHELRTPLAAIKSSIDIINSETPGKLTDDQHKFLDKAKSNIDRLNRLINDILDLSKMESGKMEMHFSSIDIYKLISEFVEVQKPLAAKKNLFVEVEIEPNLPAILADNDRLLQIFNNLVNNAIKFTDQGGITISVKSAEEKNFIEFMVQDTGRGVKEEDLRKLFEKFQQVGDSTKQVSGTGLGLAICKEIVKLHGGQIWADSKWMEGTAFTFLLPI